MNEAPGGQAAAWAIVPPWSDASLHTLIAIHQFFE